MSERVTIVGTIATTRYIEKYNARLDPTVLEQLREGALSGEFLLQLQHDSFRPWDAEVQRAWIEEAVDGEQELKAEFVVDRALYEEMTAEFARAGGPGGLSFTASEPQQTVKAEGQRSSARPPSIALDADAAAWSDADRLAAGELLRELGEIDLGRLMELSAAADVAKAIVEIPLEIWDEVLLGAGSGLLADALKSLIKKRRARSVVEIRNDRRVDRIVARIETDDPEVVEAAVSGLGEDVPAHASGNFEFDSERGLWVPHDTRR